MAGYFAFVNISANNFSDNHAPLNRGLVHLRGMDKLLTIERNRFNNNTANWMVKHEMWGHTIRVSGRHLSKFRIDLVDLRADSAGGDPLQLFRVELYRVESRAASSYMATQLCRRRVRRAARQYQLQSIRQSTHGL